MLFLARIIDGLSGGNISTARAYVADVTEPKDRARAYGLIGAAFGLGFIFGPAISGVLVRFGMTAPIWAAAGITVVAMVMALFWLPESRRQVSSGTGTPFRNLAAMVTRPGLRQILAIDFGYWSAFAIFQTTFALFAARRFGFDAPQTAYFFAAFAVLGAVVQGTLIRPIVGRFGDKQTFMLGLVCASAGLIAATLTHSVQLFAVALVPLALGIGFGHPTVSSLVSRAARGDEQGRVQGAASAVESLGRTIGPVWGSATLQRFGESTPYVSAAGFLLMTLILSVSYDASDSKGMSR
jgi:DHA1 family tetracycline resistance protein-like MFS transporter